MRSALFVMNAAATKHRRTLLGEAWRAARVNRLLKNPVPELSANRGRAERLSHAGLPTFGD